MGAGFVCEVGLVVLICLLAFYVCGWVMFVVLWIRLSVIYWFGGLRLGWVCDLVRCLRIVIRLRLVFGLVLLFCLLLYCLVDCG